MFVRVVRFTDVTSSRVKELQARIEEADGPPPDVPATGLQLVFDETHGTAVVLQLFETEEDMKAGDRAFGAMDSAETPGTRVSVDMGELKIDMRVGAWGPLRRVVTDRTLVDVVRMGETSAARLELEPGWLWSECIKPVAGTESCTIRHVGIVQSGTMHIAHDDGSELDIGAGQAYVIEKGHDAWVVGDEGLVAFEFEHHAAETFARGSV